MRYAREDRCSSISQRCRVSDAYEGTFWFLKFHRTTGCKLLVLPYAVRWLDWRWYQYDIQHVVQNIRSPYQWRRRKYGKEG
jgi:hypothetical protein